MLRPLPQFSERRILQRNCRFQVFSFRERATYRTFELQVFTSWHRFPGPLRSLPGLRARWELPESFEAMQPLQMSQQSCQRLCASCNSYGGQCGPKEDVRFRLNMYPRGKRQESIPLQLGLEGVQPKIGRVRMFRHVCWP